jgi:hypothetical protein
MKLLLVPLAMICVLLVAGPMPAAGAGDCSQVAQQEASRTGATVLAAQAVNQNGQTVCVIKLRIPGSGGRPPRVETVRRSG